MFIHSDFNCPTISNLYRLNLISSVLLLAALSVPTAHSEALPSTLTSPCAGKTVGNEATYSDLNAVTSSEFNFAASLLFQWWGLFEGPDGMGTPSFFDDIFAENVSVGFGDSDIHGIGALKKVYAGLPPGIDSAHHIQDIQVTRTGLNNYALEAHFVYQVRTGNDDISATSARYDHTISKTPEGDFVLLDVRSTTLGDIEDPQFDPAHLNNRARAAITQYLGITDQLNSDYAQLSQVMGAETEIHGMFDPKAATFNERGDGILRGIEEISGWLSSRKGTFSCVAHNLGDISVHPLDEQRLQVSANVVTQAWPLEGETILVEIPISMILRDTGEQFMLIERIER